MIDPQSDLSRLLHNWAVDAPGAEAAVFELCYEELRRAARRIFAQERPDFTLRPTEIVNEAFLRLGGANIKWENSRHFLAVFTRAMRRVVIDHSRSTNAKKRPPRQGRRQFGETEESQRTIFLDEAIAVSQGLEAFDAVDPRRAEILSLHFFVGLTFGEIGDVVGKSEDAVKKDWYVARLWLARYFAESESGAASATAP